MAPFGGYTMPIQYAGILQEHEAARTHAALFDTCHMGEVRIEGERAESDLESLLSCRIGTLAIGQCRYGLMCAEDGGTIDDLLVYRLAPQAFLLVVNAGTREGDVVWLQEHVSSDTQVEDQSDATAKIDLQGPASPRILADMVDLPLAELRYFRFMRGIYHGEPFLVSRTGYTGEIGFEWYGPNALAETFWDAATTRGAVPAGLGARDTLRLEMGMPLYGHELGRGRNAAETGFAQIADDKLFIGAEAIRLHAGRRRLVGLRLEGRRAAREGDAVLAEGRKIGRITSGSFAPTLGVAVALAYVECESVRGEGGVTVQTHRAELPAQCVKLPFVSGTAREPIAHFLAGRPEHWMKTERSRR